MDKQLQADAAFAEMVNQKLIDEPGVYGHLLSSHEAYRQFIIETRSHAATMTPEEWFATPRNQGYIAVIREDRLAYEAALKKEDESSAADNAVVEELQKLRAEVEQLRASQQKAPAEDPPTDPEPAAVPAPEPDPDATEDTEAA